MVSTAVIRTGLVGFGLAGRVFHEPFLATNPAFRLEAIATGNPERQAEARARGNYDIVDRPEQLFGRDLDLIVLASPPAAHLPQGIAALESGAALVIDKPFAASVAEAEQLIEVAELVGRPLIVFQNRRWDGDFLTVRKLVESGQLGKVFRFESTFERYAGPARDRWQDAASRAEGAGITFDLGSHLVDQALQLFGPASLERAELRVVRESGASEDDAFLSLAHTSGVTSHITVSRMAAQAGPRFRVLGSESAYSVYGLDNQEAALKMGARPTDPGFGVVPKNDWGLLGGETGVAPTPVATERGNYAEFYEGVAATLLQGAPAPVDARDALATLRILEQAHVGAGAGRSGR
jgi:scyllo-inositol 2-dehydrogenase (NADP+)